MLYNIFNIFILTYRTKKYFRKIIFLIDLTRKFILDIVFQLTIITISNINYMTYFQKSSALAKSYNQIAKNTTAKIFSLMLNEKDQEKLVHSFRKEGKELFKKYKESQYLDLSEDSLNHLIIQISKIENELKILVIKDRFLAEHNRNIFKKYLRIIYSFRKKRLFLIN